MTDSLDPNSFDLKGKKSSKLPLVIVGVLAVGGIGFFVWKSMQTRDNRKRHAELIEEFAKLEKEEVGKFWACILGQGVDPNVFSHNLELSARITSQFAVDPKNYPTKVREECTPKAKDARDKVLGLSGPSDYDAALKKYGDALKELGAQLDAWTKVAPAQVKDMQIGKALNQAGSAWHSFEGGKPAPEVANYDRFLHCAVPNVDKMKDGQALVEYLFNECKKPDYLTTLNEKCGPELIADPAGPPTKGFATAQKKLAGDDRALSAFDDCMRKGRKGKRRDDLADVGKAWVAWREAGIEIRKIGSEALKD
jgi:hypothetical protein